LEQELIDMLEELVETSAITTAKELIKELVKKTFESLSNRKDKKGR